MSRHPHALCAPAAKVAIALLAVACLFSTPAIAPAGVISVDVDAYRLDGGQPVTGPWEIAEKLAVAKDVAIVVMDQKASSDRLQTLLQLLETLKVPTLFTKKADYKILLDRGVIQPTAAKPATAP